MPLQFDGLEAYTFSTRLATTRQMPIARILLTLLTLTLTAPALAQGAADDNDAVAKTIVEKADEVRFPRDGFEVNVTIVTTAPDEAADERRYRVLSKGNQNTIVIATEPASDRGQAMLMKGRDLWIFLPSVSQPVRLSLAQRLTGQVANGDLARANFAGDYVPKLVATEKIDGEPTYVLELTAVDRGVTYHRVMYWVRQSGYRPHKAEFYSLSGNLIKTCSFRDYRQSAGRMRPTRLVMEDALHSASQSVLEYQDMKAKTLPDKMFSKDYLKRVE